MFSFLSDKTILDRQVVQECLPNLQTEIRSTEEKRGIGKNKSFRSGYDQVVCSINFQNNASIEF